MTIHDRIDSSSRFHHMHPNRRTLAPMRAPCTGESGRASSHTWADLVNTVERVAEALEQVGLQADRIVEAVGLQGPVAVDNQGRES